MSAVHMFGYSAESLLNDQMENLEQIGRFRSTIKIIKSSY